MPKLSRIKVKKAVSSCVFRTFSSVSMLTNLTALLLHSSRQQRRCGSHLGSKRVQKVVRARIASACNVIIEMAKIDKSTTEI